jgi:hypothetical protein
VGWVGKLGASYYRLWCLRGSAVRSVGKERSEYLRIPPVDITLVTPHWVTLELCMGEFNGRIDSWIVTAVRCIDHELGWLCLSSSVRSSRCDKEQCTEVKQGLSLRRRRRGSQGGEGWPTVFYMRKRGFPGSSNGSRSSWPVTTCAGSWKCRLHQRRQ